MLTGIRHWQASRAFKAIPRDERCIVFYAESGQDWHHFRPVVEYLTEHLGESIIYITSTADDPVLALEHPGIRAFNIGSGLVRTAFFQWLDADVMVMTMGDFHNLQLKRSVNPVYYAFMFHTLVSTHMVDHANTYDHYDAILCAGPHHIREIRKRETLHRLQAKELFEHGYSRIEELAAQRREPPPHNDSDIHVLLAPSWGEHTILNSCGLELTAALLDAGFKVTLRPHYQTRWTTPEVIDRITEQFGNHSKFTLVEQMAENDSLFDSHLMITDWSGAGMDYALGLEKPVLYIDVPVKARNDAWPELEIEPFESFIRDKIGSILSPDDLDQVGAEIRKLLQNPKAFQQNIGDIRREWVFNYGTSAVAAATAIQEMFTRAHARHSTTGDLT